MREYSRPINLIFFSKYSLFRFICFFFSFYLLAGNILRFFSLGGFYDHVLISELMLYSFCLPILFTRKIFKRSYFLGFSFVVFFSFVQGTISYGFYLKALLYGLKLVAMVGSGVVVGELLFKKFELRIKEFWRYWIRLYAFSCLLGYIIFFLFPSSTSLWIVLSRFGIFLRGDPHSSRFISLYFDPNYFCAIAVIPFLFSWLIKREEKKGWYQYAYILFALTIVLTWSRSGIATFVMILFFLCFHKIYSAFSFTRKNLSISGLVAIFFLVVLGFSLNQFSYFMHRLIDFTNDVSALARLHTFQLGMDFFCKNPWGIGYNNLAVILDQYNKLSSVDSSLLATLICFGGPIFLGFCICYLFFCSREWFRFRAMQKDHPELYQSFLYLFVYLQVVVFFTSWFNNILYLQFWLIPMIAIFNYLSLCRKSLNLRIT